MSRASSLFIPNLIAHRGVLSLFACSFYPLIFSTFPVLNASLCHTMYRQKKQTIGYKQCQCMNAPCYVPLIIRPAPASHKPLCYTLGQILLRLLQQNRVLVHLILCCLLTLRLELSLRPFTRDTTRRNAALAESATFGDVELYGGTGGRLGGVFRYGGRKRDCRRSRNRRRGSWFGYFSESVKHTFASGLGKRTNVIHSQTGCGNWGKHYHSVSYINPVVNGFSSYLGS